MKQILLVLFSLSLLGLHAARAQELPCNNITLLTTELKSIRDSDQNVRLAFIKQMQHREDSVALKNAIRQMHAVDLRNQQYVGRLLDQCGWPQGLGGMENNTIFLVIDHADTVFMNKYFSLIKQQAQNGVVQKSDFATLQDRLLMRKGQKQLYGTQTFSSKTIKATTFWPIEDPAHLAERRKEMGLMPMDEYIKLLKTSFGPDVVWDKSLSVEMAKNSMKKQK